MHRRHNLEAYRASEEDDSRLCRPLADLAVVETVDLKITMTMVKTEAACVGNHGVHTGRPEALDRQVVRRGQGAFEEVECAVHRRSKSHSRLRCARAEEVHGPSVVVYQQAPVLSAVSFGKRLRHRPDLQTERRHHQSVYHNLYRS